MRWSERLRLYEKLGQEEILVSRHLIAFACCHKITQESLKLKLKLSALADCVLVGLADRRSVGQVG